MSDDGRGFDVAAVERRPEGGIGLAHMRERIDTLGGRLSIVGRRSPTGATSMSKLDARNIVEMVTIARRIRRFDRLDRLGRKEVRARAGATPPVSRGAEPRDLTSANLGSRRYLDEIPSLSLNIK